MGPDGYSFFDTEYDYQGRKIKKSYYNQNCEKVAPYNLNFHAFVNEYQDNQDKQSYYDINGDLIDAVNGYAVLYSELCLIRMNLP